MEMIETFVSYHDSIKKCVCLVYDPQRSARGFVGVRAIRLKEGFIDLFKDQKLTGEAGAVLEGQGRGVGRIQIIIVGVERGPISRDSGSVARLLDVLEVCDTAVSVTFLFSCDLSRCLTAVRCQPGAGLRQLGSCRRGNSGALG
jgi:hypothetical protein